MIKDEKITARLRKVYEAWLKAALMAPAAAAGKAIDPANIDDPQFMPSPHDALGHRFDEGRGTTTMSLAQFEFWALAGRYERLGPLDHLERVEFWLASGRKEDVPIVPDYTYTLF